MAKPGFKFFLNPALNREAHYFNRLGMFYAGKVVALDLAAKYKVEPIHILIRAEAHAWTFNTQKRGLVPDELHLTVDIKDAGMIRDNKHLTAHGYLSAKQNTNDFTNMWSVGSVEAKEDKAGVPRIEKDEYFDYFREKQVNNWNMATLKAFDEPEELARVQLGDEFITVPIGRVGEAGRYPESQEYGRCNKRRAASKGRFRRGRKTITG